MRSAWVLRRALQSSSVSSRTGRAAGNYLLTNHSVHSLLPASTKPILSLRCFSSAPLQEDETTSGWQSEPKRRRFEDLDLHPKSLKALRRHGLHKLTEIQEETYDLVVSGRDVVGRARTGTGKTLSFLLPSLERIVRQENLRPGVQILVLSPTRELAAQIAKEAEQLVAQHSPEITSQVIFGGSSKREDIERFHNKLPTILVATPGRLKDHLASTFLDGRQPFIDVMKNLQVLVLDETDRLLDMGFRRDIQDILSCLPKRKRQTLLFSATLPRNVKRVVDLATRPDYEMVDCIQDEDPASHTNAQTEQSHIILPPERFWTGSMQYLLDLMDKGGSKVMVFFPMTSMVQLYAQIFNMKFGRRVWELHGKMQQRERTTISQRFRNASKGVLFTSDVSARGVDYPNVTHVVQIGASDSRETYIHRLGRTGRAGKRGQGLLILPQVEDNFLQTLDGLEIPLDKRLQAKLASSPPSKKLQNELGPVIQGVRKGRDPKLENAVQDSYQAMISYYFQRCDDQKADEVVATINRLVQDMGLRELPSIELHRARKIGVDSVRGLNIAQSWKDQSWTGKWVADGPSHNRPGKPYGDFNGKFEDDEWGSRQFGRRNSSSGNSHNSRRDGARKPNRDHNSRWDGARKPNRDHGPQKRRSSSSWKKGSDRQLGRRYEDAFAKLGWKKDAESSGLSSGKSQRVISKKKAKTFQRWEATGEFQSRG